MIFSIIIPLYNVEEFIEECIESVVCQNTDDYEIIIVNDGSNDNSLPICEKIAEKYENISVYSKMNEGVIETRKYAAQKSIGKYIINLDGDDILSKGIIEKLREIINEYDSPDAIFFDLETMGDGDAKEIRNAAKEGLYKDTELQSLRSTYMYSFCSKGLNSGDLLPSAGGKAVKRDIYLQSITKVPSYIFQAEDLIQNQIILTECNSLFVLHNCGYKYRVRSSSASQTVNLNYIVNVFNVFDYLIENFPEQENQILVYTIIRIWNTIAHLYKNNIPLNELRKNLFTNQYKESRRLFENVRLGNCTPIDYLKVLIVKKGLWKTWSFILRVKY